MAVTDQMFATGATSVARFSLSGIEGEVSPDRRYVCVAGKPQTLFSSLLTMDVACSNILSVLTRPMSGIWHREHPAMDFESALVAAARICATNAADMLGLRDDPAESTGAVEPGRRADLVLGDVEGSPGDYRFHVRRLFVRGREVALAPPHPIRLD